MSSIKKYYKEKMENHSFIENEFKFSLVGKSVQMVSSIELQYTAFGTRFLTECFLTHLMTNILILINEFRR